MHFRSWNFRKILFFGTPCRQEAGALRSSRKETNSAGGNFSEASTLIARSLGTDNCSGQGINVHLRDFQSCSTYRWWRWLDINSDTNLMQPEMVFRQAAGVWQTLPSKCDKNWNKNLRCQYLKQYLHIAWCLTLNNLVVCFFENL